MRIPAMANEADKSGVDELELLIERMTTAEFGEGGAAERAELERFVADRPGRQELRASVAGLWQSLGRLEAPALSGEIERLPVWRRAPQVAIAAGLAPLLVLAGLLAFMSGAFDTGHYRTELHASTAERRIVNLPDGSTVSLSAESIVEVDIAPTERNFVLKQGEALFDVAHDADRPFVVSAGEGRIQAVGTAFNVRLADDAGVVVTVVEGVVKVEAGRNAAGQGRGGRGLVQLATAGQQVRFGTRDRASMAGSVFITPPEAVDPGRYASWAEGLLRFEGEPLSQVIEEVNRHSATDIRLNDPSLASTPIYGVLHIGDVEGLKSIVADIGRIDRDKVSQKIEIVSDGR